MLFHITTTQAMLSSVKSSCLKFLKRNSFGYFGDFVDTININNQKGPVECRKHYGQTPKYPFCPTLYPVLSIFSTYNGYANFQNIVVKKLFK